MASLRRLAGRAVQWSLLLFLTLLLVEGSLRVVGVFAPRITYLLQPAWDRATPADTAFGHRMSPFLEGIDRRGYRNSPEDRPNPILAIGDSYTFGFGAPSDSTWPRQFEVLAGVPVYNGGIGGYGPCEYEKVLKALIALHPRLVILGIHPGNDLGDAYRIAYLTTRCMPRRSRDGAILTALARADSVKTIEARAVELGWEGAPVSDSGSWRHTARLFVSNHVRIYGLVRALRYERSLRAITQRNESEFDRAVSQPLRIAYTGGRARRTVFKRPGDVRTHG